MKRYLLFMGSTHYSAGGWQDFRGYLDSPDEADARRAEVISDAGHEDDDGWWWHLVDGNSGTIILRSEAEAHV